MFTGLKNLIKINLAKNTVALLTICINIQYRSDFVCQYIHPIISAKQNISNALHGKHITLNSAADHIMALKGE